MAHTFYAAISPDQLDGMTAYMCDLQFVNAIEVAQPDDDTVVVHIATTEEGFQHGVHCPEYLGYTESDVYAVYPDLDADDIIDTEDGPVAVPRLRGGW